MSSLTVFVSFPPDYAEPTAIGQKLGSTFRPNTDEGYTTPFILNHYDTPGNLPEYAEPLPPEPEYATPFSDPPGELNMSGKISCAHRIPTSAPVSGAALTSSHAQYDCPSHRMLSNGYCTPVVHANGPRPVSVVYAEPKSCDSLQRNHTYEEPLWAQWAQTQRRNRLLLADMCTGSRKPLGVISSGAQAVLYQEYTTGVSHLTGVSVLLLFRWERTEPSRTVYTLVSFQEVCKSSVNMSWCTETMQVQTLFNV